VVGPGHGYIFWRYVSAVVIWLLPSAVRVASGDRHAWVQAVPIFRSPTAVLYFSSADFPPNGPVSHASSSKVLSLLNNLSATFTWHLITAPVSLQRFLATVSAHFCRPLASVAVVLTVPASSPLGSICVVPSQ